MPYYHVRATPGWVTGTFVDEVGDTMTGRLLIQSDNGLYVGAGDDLKITLSSDDIYIKQTTSDKDMLFNVLDGAADTNILLLDGDVSIARFKQDAGITIGAGNDYTISLSSDNVTVANATQDKDISWTVNDGGSTKTVFQLDGDVATVRCPQDAGMTIGAGNDLAISISSDDVLIKNVTQDKDIYLHINDGSVDTAVLQIDGDVARAKVLTDAGMTVGAGSDLDISVSSDDIYVKNATSDKDIYFNVLDGAADTNVLLLDGDVSIARFKQDAGVTVGAGDDLAISVSSDDVLIKNVTQDKDIYLHVNDGSVDTAVFQIDGDVSRAKVLTDAGMTVGAGSDLDISVSSDDIYIKNITSDKDIYFNVLDGAADTSLIQLDGDVGIVRFLQDVGISLGAGNDLTIVASSDNIEISNVTQDKDIIFKVNDGGVTTTVLTLDGDVPDIDIACTLNIATTNASGLVFGSLGTATKAIDFSGSGLSGSTDYPIYLDANNYWAADGRWKGHIRWQLVHSGTNSAPEAYIDAYNDQYNYGSLLFFRKSHNDSEGSLTPTIDTTILGSIVFDGVDSGSAFDRGAIIRAIQDGAAGTTVPTKITFTTYDDSGNYTIGLQIEKDGDLTLAKTSGTSVISTGSTAGVARAVHFDIPVAAGGAANAALDFQFQIDSTLEAGLLSETDGSGAYQDSVWKVPYHTADYGEGWASPPAPAPASIANGSMFIAYNSNGAEANSRIYAYSNGAWVSAALS